MSSQKSLIEFVENLHTESDEKKVSSQVVTQFLEKLKQPIDYEPLLKRFTCTREYFAELDDMLVQLGYASDDEAIYNIKEHILEHLNDMSSVEYNLYYGTNFWIPIDYLRLRPSRANWCYLSRNPAAFYMLEAADHSYIDWRYMSLNPYVRCIMIFSEENTYWPTLSANPTVIDVLEKNPGKINWSHLSLNTAAISLLTANKDKIDWHYLSANTAAIDLLAANPDKIDWHYLSMNSAAISLLIANKDKIDWRYLSLNVAAIDLLEANLDKIDWDYLSMNPAAIKLLEQNPGKINWHFLSANPEAIDLLRANPTKIHMGFLSMNPYDFDQKKLDHFNSQEFFPRSHLKLYNNDTIDYKKSVPIWYYYDLIHFT